MDTHKLTVLALITLLFISALITSVSGDPMCSHDSVAHTREQLRNAAMRQASLSEDTTPQAYTPSGSDIPSDEDPGTAGPPLD